MLPFAAIRVILLIGALFIWSGGTIAAAATATTSNDTIGTVIANAERMVAQLDAGNLDTASDSFALVKQWWKTNKAGVKQQSLTMSLEIDNQIAGLSLAFLNKDAAKASDLAGTLRFSLRNYSDGAFTDNSGKSEMTLDTYVMKLQHAADLMRKQAWADALDEVKLLQRQWLSIEGDVVSQSQTKYNNAERDLVLMDAYLSSSDKQAQALPVAIRLNESLTTLIGAQYSWWDAALIPLREGLEGLLVVGTLLMYAKKSGSAAAKRWVIGGSSIAVLVCLVVGFIVAVLLSSSAFGHNNSLINGWTGVCASVLLLYVSYWLHRNSDVKRWNKLLQMKSSEAITSGRMISLALLAFFAIVREGLETVIFLVGMGGKMPGTELAAGIAAGFGILAVCAVVLIKMGTRLPVKPVFLVSSVIVFYLCFKFMGSGIHSLQMAGVIPSTVEDYLPERMTFSIYPSWYSTLPQLTFVVIAVAVVSFQKLSGYRAGKRLNILTSTK
ncbi:FTR1 family iron permease [Cohnella yongneupensis]|uniref:FTR1 family protein n=1 Tax=Cohnella yongneupensis TaxID=425006 RepID=A0ABW0QZQ7_9BACL